MQQPDWEKMDGLLPAIVQHAEDHRVLMLGYMNREALDRTVDTGRVTFWSRSRQCLWTKGETSGNYLRLESMGLDCDGDALLLRVRPTGPVCHLGTPGCFDSAEGAFLPQLAEVLRGRGSAAAEQSYTRRLLDSGLRRIAQKVGEEGVETALAAVAGNKEELLDETADLMYHLLVLLQASQLSFSEVEQRLRERHQPAQDAG